MRLPAALIEPRGLGPVIAGFALLAALAALAASAAFVLAVEGKRIEAMGRTITVAVADRDAGAQAARAAAVAAMLRGRHDLGEVRAGTLGPDFGGSPPAVIDATLEPGRDEHALRRALAGQAGIAVYHEDGALAPLLLLLRKLERIAVIVAIACLGGMALIAALAARARMAAAPQALILLDRFGATGAQVSGLVAQTARREALIGSLGGLVFGVVAMLFIAGALRNPDVSAVTAPHVAPSAWLILAAIPPIAVGLATLSAQATALLVWARRR